MNHPLPEAALDGRICVVGISGSGKSTTAKGGVERLLTQDRRVCVVDLLDGWWGLRVARDGRTPAFPVAIFGGQHGDLPLTEHAGALIGQAVAQSEGSSIVSLSELDGDAARRRFALAFFDALHKMNRAPLHLVIDEADFYAPQQPVKDGPGPLLLNRIKEIAARGRMRGFRVWPITQRPAKLHKDVLSQADTLVAMQLTSSQDRDAIEGWIGDQGERAIGRSILASLPSLKMGHGVLWAPRLGILETVHFPLPMTYDSSRTPDYGATAAAVALKPIDLGVLRERLASIEVEAKTNDPAALKAEVRRLERELERALAVAGPSHDQLAAEREAGFRYGLAAATRAIQAIEPTSGEPMPPARSAAPRPAVRAATAPSAEGDRLPKGERLTLTVLAQYHPARVDSSKAAAIAGYSPRSSTWRNILSRLRQAGHIAEGPSPFVITAAGLAALGTFDPLPTGQELLEYWMAQVGKGERETLRILGTLRGECQSTDLAQRAGYAATSSTWRNILSRLRTLGLIEGSRTIKLHGDLR